MGSTTWQILLLPTLHPFRILDLSASQGPDFHFPSPQPLVLTTARPAWWQSAHSYPVSLHTLRQLLLVRSINSACSWAPQEPMRGDREESHSLCSNLYWEKKKKGQGIGSLVHRVRGWSGEFLLVTWSRDVAQATCSDGPFTDPAPTQAVYGQVGFFQQQ